MLLSRRKLRIETERMTMRPPIHSDFRAWVALRRASEGFLRQWEPDWSKDHLSRKGFANRVYWSNRAVTVGNAVPLFLFRREDKTLLGAITLDNIRRGPSQTGTLGYWIGETHARSGYMREAITALVHHTFERLDLSRIEAACLPENSASRGVLEKCGFKYEGVAQSYLQINGRWSNHVLYSSLRMDRRGRTAIG